MNLGNGVQDNTRHFLESGRGRSELLRRCGLFIPGVDDKVNKWLILWTKSAEGVASQKLLLIGGYQEG